MKVSLVPQTSSKFAIVDCTKGITLELRSLPPIEVLILLPESYPSNASPLFMLDGANQSNRLFYEPMRNFLYERLNEKWAEDTIVLYDCVYFV